MRDNKKTVILGAGPAGLAAAWNFVDKGHNNIIIFEKNDKVGGMVRSEKFNGNIYEYGAHYFHMDEKALLNKILALLDGNYVENRRNLQIRFKGKYFQYPLRINDLIKGFNFLDLTVFFFSMIYAFIGNKVNGRQLVTAEEALTANYGKKLYQEFFEDYITSFWGMHPSRLSAIFALRRIPKMDILVIFKKFLSAFKLINQNGPQDKFIENVDGNLYYPRLGMGRIWQGIADAVSGAGVPIYTNCRLKQIINNGNRIDAVLAEIDGKEHIFETNALISTVPIYDLVNGFKYPDPGILRTSSELKYRSLVIFGMLVRKERLLPSYCAYFRERAFSRLSEPKLAGLEIHPHSKTVLLVEVSCDFDDEIWNNPEWLKDRVLQELTEEGILEASDVEEVHVLRERHAYPIYDVGYESRIEAIREYLSGYKNLYSAGRQGLFQYINSHMAIKSGIAVSDYVLKEWEKTDNQDNNLFY